MDPRQRLSIADDRLAAQRACLLVTSSKKQPRANHSVWRYCLTPCSDRSDSSGRKTTLWKVHKLLSETRANGAKKVVTLTCVMLSLSRASVSYPLCLLWSALKPLKAES
jgi:hypothetical protein